MLSELFEPLDSEIKSLTAHIKSVDSLYVLFIELNYLFIFVYLLSIVLYLFVRMSESTAAVQNCGAFLNKLFAGNLILLKREDDSYIVRLKISFLYE